MLLARIQTRIYMASSNCSKGKIELVLQSSNLLKTQIYPWLLLMMK